jgi:hypothetical protein
MKLAQFRNPPGELPYQNETVYSLSSKSFQRSKELARHLFEHSASLPLFLIWPDRSDDDSSQNSRSVRRRTSSKPNARKKAKQGTLSETLGGSAITHHKNSPSNQEIRSGQGKGSPSATNCLGYIQQIQTLQAENASLQRQLRGVKKKFKCPLYPHKYSRTDLLNRHIHPPATTILQRLPFSSDYQSPATTNLQRLPFSSPFSSLAPEWAPLALEWATSGA